MTTRNDGEHLRTRKDSLNRRAGWRMPPDSVDKESEGLHSARLDFSSVSAYSVHIWCDAQDFVDREPSTV